MHNRDPYDLSNRHPMKTGALYLPLLSLSFSSLSFSLSPPLSLSFPLSLSLFHLVSHASMQDARSTMGHTGCAQGQSARVGPRHAWPNSLSLSPHSLSSRMLYPSLSPCMLSLSFPLFAMLSPFLSLSPLQRRERPSIRHLISLLILSLLQRRERSSIRCSISLPILSLSQHCRGERDRASSARSLSRCCRGKRDRDARSLSPCGWRRRGGEGRGLIPTDANGSDNSRGDASGNNGGDGDNGDGGERRQRR